MAFLVKEFVNVLPSDFESFEGSLNDKPGELLIMLSVIIEQSRHDSHKIADSELQELAGKHLQIILVEVQRILTEKQGISSLFKNHLKDCCLRANMDRMNRVYDLPVHFLQVPERVVIVLLLLLRFLGHHVLVPMHRISVKIEAELRAHDDVLVHVHQRRDERSPQDRHVKIKFIESQLYLPAKVECFVRRHIILSYIRLARYQKVLIISVVLLNHHRLPLLIIFLARLIVHVVLVLQKVLRHLLAKQLQVLFLVRHSIEEVDWHLILDLEGDLVVVGSVSVHALGFLVFVALVFVADEETVAADLEFVLVCELRSEKYWGHLELLLKLIYLVIFSFLTLFLVPVDPNILYQWKTAKIPCNYHLIDLPIALE